ncbi:MAG: hypothetical protein QOH27_4462 [Mycobacterium sp.]|nr:hypothetical protein [Mycobacterium sp.]
MAAGVVADATAGADLELEVRRSAEARQDFPWRWPTSRWRPVGAVARRQSTWTRIPSLGGITDRRNVTGPFRTRARTRVAGPVGALGTSIAGAAGADCSGSLPSMADDPDSLELEDDPESLGPDDDGSSSVDPDDDPESLDDAADDDPESGDAAAYPAPVPSPGRVASTPQAMARPASKRLLFTVGFATSVRRSRREDPGAEQHESDEGRREVGEHQHRDFHRSTWLRDEAVQRVQ